MNGIVVVVAVIGGVTIEGKVSSVDEELTWDVPAFACSSVDESFVNAVERITTSSSTTRMDLM